MLNLRLKLSLGNTQNNRDPSSPTIVTDFSASDDKEDIIIMTWTKATAFPAAKSDLYNSSGLIQTNINSPYPYETTPTTDNYYVKSYNSEGSTDSNIDSGTCIETPPLPLVPTAIDDLSGSAGDTQSTLTWSAPDSGTQPITGYEVFRNGSTIGTTSNLTFTDNGLINDTTYNYTVTAVSSVGSSLDSNQISVTPIKDTAPISGAYPINTAIFQGQTTTISLEGGAYPTNTAIFQGSTATIGLT